MSIKINVGCGQTPTEAWRNYDNSWSIRLANRRLVTSILGKLGFLSAPQKQFISFAEKANILWANATERIPEEDGSVDVVYSSHMIEHLQKEDALLFLNEARRVLKIGGIVRIAVPDIMFQTENYLRHRDADKFLEATHLTRTKPRNVIARMKYLMIGDRNHQWMYDGRSLCKLLSSAGFQESKVMEAGTTSIADPGALDLEERSPESVFVEATNP